MVGGIAFIFIGTGMLSVLTNQVFYNEAITSAMDSGQILFEAQVFIESEVNAIKNRILSVIASCTIVLAIKPICHGVRSRIERTSAVFNLQTLLGSVMAGIVSITGCGGHIDAISSMITGGIGGVIYMISGYAFERLQYDDPVQATQTSLVCGIWSSVALGLFDQDRGLITTKKLPFFIVQCVGALSVFVICFSLTWAYFRLVRKRFHLRLSKIEEVLGQDLIEDATLARIVLMRED